MAVTRGARYPIVPVLEHYGVVVSAQGGWGKVLCFAHSETHASCSVNVDTGWWKCHACGEHGDAVDAIRAIEGVDRARAEEIVRGITGAVPQDAPVRGFSGRRTSRGGFRPTFGPAGSFGRRQEV